MKRKYSGIFGCAGLHLIMTFVVALNAGALLFGAEAPPGLSTSVSASTVLDVLLFPLELLVDCFPFLEALYIPILLLNSLLWGGAIYYVFFLIYKFFKYLRS